MSYACSTQAGRIPREVVLDNANETVKRMTDVDREDRPADVGLSRRRRLGHARQTDRDRQDERVGSGRLPWKCGSASESAALPLLFLILVAFSSAAGQDPATGPVQPVPAVDLARYMGRWHEVARLPNRFQADCVGETTADYTLLPNGQVRVVNSCLRSDGSRKRAEGRARLARRDGPASMLRVRFAPGFLSFLSMVWGDYWILDLTEDYGAALVGDPGRNYLWILSRTPQLLESTYDRMVATAASQGFAVRRLVRAPPQTATLDSATTSP